VLGSDGTQLALDVTPVLPLPPEPLHAANVATTANALATRSNLARINIQNFMTISLAFD
jgi:hypothetical protein